MMPRALTLAACCLCLILSVASAQGIGPDIVVGEIVGTSNYGSFGGISAFSVGTTSCNAGDQIIGWYANTNQHPVIGQNLLRLESGRFEQIGMSWLKHGFGTMNGTYCSPCSPTAGQTLGVGCSDPYSSGTNGMQSVLGPRSEVNASQGYFPYPFGSPPYSSQIDRRLQVKNTDIDSGLHPSARYFVEVQYVSPDDAGAGNGTNSSSWREALFTEVGGFYSMMLFGPTVMTQPGVMAWKQHDSGVAVTNVDIPGDGRFHVGFRASDAGGGLTHYECVVHNMTSTRSAKGFTVHVPTGATIQNVEFHSAPHHSGDGYVIGTDYDNSPWVATITPDSLTWSTPGFAAAPNGNALRWGSLFTFRFDLDQSPPTTGLVVDLDLYRHGLPSQVSATLIPGDSLTKTSGDNQLTVYGENFQPLTVRLATPSGTPAVGAPITFTVTSGNATVVSPATVTTNSLGEASCTVAANIGLGGPIQVKAAGTAADTTFALCSRGLSVAYNPTYPALGITVRESPFGNPTEPYLMMAGNPQPLTPTSFGTLCLNPSDHANTIVVWDGFGAFGGGSYQGRPTVGNPNITNIYMYFPNPAGMTLLFQGIGYNPALTSIGWWATNCVTMSF